MQYIKGSIPEEWWKTATQDGGGKCLVKKTSGLIVIFETGLGEVNV